MKLADIVVHGTPVAVPTSAELEGLHKTLGARLPEGYDEFMLRLGEGLLGGSYIRVYPPWRILAELEAWRERIGQYWFWRGLDQARAIESIVIGDTVDGDEIIFHPSDPDALWVLPRNADDAFKAGRGLWESLEWLCSSGILTQPFSERAFEPFDSRTSQRAG